MWLTDFRAYRTAEFAPAPGLTVLIGGNGEGKTSVLEAVGYLATLSSFRGVATEALVRDGCNQAVVRAEAEGNGRRLLLEAEIARSGRSRLSVNRQPLRRARDLLGVVRATVFSPDDLVLVKGGPAERRRYLDELLAGMHPRFVATISDFERVLRQRNTLLRQCAGRLDASAATTLEVWDGQLVATGEVLGAARADLVARLEPLVAEAYGAVAGGTEVAARYQAPWRDDGLAGALAATRVEELRRGISLVGPHRDDLTLSLHGLPARSHASQGEQRSLALALRLASHHLVLEETGEAPILLLDDVFSELDAARSDALLTALPEGQALLTTAGDVPAAARPERVVHIRGGSIGQDGPQG